MSNDSGKRSKHDGELTMEEAGAVETLLERSSGASNVETVASTNGVYVECDYDVGPLRGTLVVSGVGDGLLGNLGVE